MNKKISIFLKQFILSIITIVILWMFWAPAIKTNAYFTQQTLGLKTYDLNDLGVVDANDDGFLDVFTTNHSSRQSLLIGDSFGKFTDVLSQWDLDQDREFSGLEDSDAEPPIDAAGLYIYRQNKLLFIRTHQTSDLGTVTGRLEISWPVSVKQKHLVDVEVREDSLSSGAIQTVLEFSVQEGGWLAVNGLDDIVEIPHSLQLNESIPLERIYIGTKLVRPSSHNFVLMWRDRHSMSWADVDGDKQMDIFMSRGGIKGKMHLLPESLSDELFIRDVDDFRDVIARSGIVKNNCPGRQSAWIDFNSDGLLDLYNACGSKEPFPNQLYQRQANGSFVDVASKVGLDLSGNEPFVWLDYDNDGDMDFVSKDGEILRLYVNQSGQFSSQSISHKLKTKLLKLTISDYDLDGDFDIYAVLQDRNTLLINNEGKYLQTDPASVGIPVKGLTANWVDYDNDGLPDLYVFPSGLYRQLPNHQFEATQLLEKKFHLSELIAARAACFDFNNDGSRDFLIAVRTLPLWVRISNRLSQLSIFFSMNQIPITRNWQSVFYKSINFKNHWLQVKLVGANENRQAIGAKVKLKTTDSTQLQHVGQAEGSHYSQGHYRLYFGLGKQNKIESLEVIWPNGQIQEFKHPEIDRLLVIEQNIATDELT